MSSARRNGDRRIHATTKDGWRIVRYDRAGKWYVEYPTSGVREPLTFADAVALATEIGSRVYLGQPGGTRFDAAVRKAAQT